MNRSLLVLLPLVSWLVLAPRAAHADDPKHAPPATTAEAAKEAPAEASKAPAPVAPAGKEGETFVDRDGDGLQDGREHRFRGRWHGRGVDGGQGGEAGWCGGREGRGRGAHQRGPR